MLVITRLDRLARSVGDLQAVLNQLAAKRVGFKCLQQGAIDTTSASGRLMTNMLGAFAEFETDLRRERQMEGIARRKAAGGYKGRPPSIDHTAVSALAAEGLGATEIARRLNIGRASVYRLLDQRQPRASATVNAAAS